MHTAGEAGYYRNQNLARHAFDICYDYPASCMPYTLLKSSKAAGSEVRSDLQTAEASLDTIVTACHAFSPAILVVRSQTYRPLLTRMQDSQL